MFRLAFLVAVVRFLLLVCFFWFDELDRTLSHCANLDARSLAISRLPTSHSRRRGLNVPRPLPSEEKVMVY